jgi:two-component system, cell cycle sensor histidine kinase and response regulator CckA
MIAAEHIGKCVLLVEDEQQVRVLIGRMLRRDGLVVHEADGGDEALRIGNKPGIKIDLLITDVMMPKLRGPALAKTLRNDHPAVQVIYMSGYPESSRLIAEQGSVTGEVLAKPFDPEDLISAVQRALDRSPVRDL